MSITLFTTWATGLFHGYKQNGIPADLKWSILGLTTAVQSLKMLGKTPVPLPMPQVLPVSLAIFVGSPIVVGTLFFTGKQFGKVIQSLEKEQKGPVRFQLA